jgi:hypothetical protein
MPPAQTATPTRSRLIALAAGALLLAAAMPASLATAAEPSGGSTPADPAALRPTVPYEEAMAHAGDRTFFAPGDRVSVPFKPRKGDRWAVGGVAPRELPAGRLSGRALRDTKTPQRPIAATADPAVAIGPADLPYLDPSTAFVAQPAAAVDPGALKREVFGFLPYWELSDSSTR